MSMDERDPDLGMAVRQLPTPPPGADFFPRLVERLREEADRMEVERQRRRWRMTSLVGLAATVLVVVMVASWVGLPGTGPGSRGVLGPRTAAAVTVEELKMIVATSVARARTVQGEITVNLPNEGVGERRWSFAITGSGDFRLTALDRREEVSYSARTGSYRTYSVTESGRVVAVETTGLATGPPDPAAEVSVLSRSLGSAVRAFLAAQTDAPVTETTYEGREAWILNAAVSQPQPPNVDELEVVVDRETGFPLRIRTATGPRGFNVRDVRISKLVVDAPVPPEHFLLQFPPGTPSVTPIDKGFRRVGRTEVAAAVGYEPLVPGVLPEGFVLQEVAVARSADRTGFNRNPVSRDVASLNFHRGFDRVTVSTRSTGGNPSLWSDPLATSGLPVERETVTLSRGPFGGTTAEVVTSLNEVPHIWAVNDRLVVTIAGDLTRDQLIAALESL